jgi:hypothetical protein
MGTSDIQLRLALEKIAKAANAALGAPPDHYGGDGVHEHSRPGGGRDPDLHCTPKTLPTRLLKKAAETAVKVNPVNAPVFGPVAQVGLAFDLSPMSIAVLVGKYWGPQPRRLTVSFLDGGPADLRRKLISHMNAWNRTAGISFVATNGVGQVRVSRNLAGYWSYLGTDILHIPTNRPTMNLQGFTMSYPDSEFHRVVRHEAGHTLGFPHEHMRRELVARIDPERAYEYFGRTQGWNRQMVDQQVLTPLDDRSIMGTPPNEDSIMCYQLPGSIMRNGQPIRGGTDIIQSDFDFAGRIYPNSTRPVEAESRIPPGRQDEMDDWDEDEDVEVDAELAG